MIGTIAKSLLACGASLSLLSGCASPWTVDRYEAPDARLGTQRSYFLKPGEYGAPTGLDPAIQSRADAAMRSAVIAELNRKGYSEAASPGTADLVVSYQVAGTRRFVIEDTTRVGAPSPTRVLGTGEVQPPPRSMLPREQAVRDGSVVLFVDDAASGKLLWRGMLSAQTRIGSTDSTIRTVADMARQIARQVPAPGR
jgi:hypothetical protein